MASVAQPQSVFEQLVEKDTELKQTLDTFRSACAELAAKNGSGEPTRRLIRSSFVQATYRATNGPSR